MAAVPVARTLAHALAVERVHADLAAILDGQAKTPCAAAVFISAHKSESSWNAF